jgi:diaminopimelate epimerase
MLLLQQNNRLIRRHYLRRQTDRNIMQIPFQKYQGTGNDFILIDARSKDYSTQLNTATIAHLCHRRFGIGADGLLLLKSHPTYDFEMVYYNADGREGSMCGNGGRCIVAYAHALGVVGRQTQFLATDGLHRATIQADGWVELEMQAVPAIEVGAKAYFLDTGSPHYVTFVSSLEGINIVEEGRKVRYSDRFARQGTNVNFVETLVDRIRVATYERGVENETLSCGTGVTAAALASCNRAGWVAGSHQVAVETKGGQLQVRFEVTEETGASNIWLCGPAIHAFSGEVDLSDS